MTCDCGRKHEDLFDQIIGAWLEPSGPPSRLVNVMAAIFWLLVGCSMAVVVTVWVFYGR